MKKLRRFLAMMMTVIMTAGTLGDAGFTVFAAEPEAEEAVSEDAVSEDDAVIPDEAVSGSDDEVTDDAVAEENEEEETEEEDLAEEETSDDKAVTKLIVNGTNMLAYGKYGHFLKPDGNAYSGSLSEAVKKPYMYYDNNGTLRLHDITLEGLYDAACGIEFEGDSLTIEIIGNNSIMLKKGVAGKNSYGIYADGDLTITSTKSDSGDRISGSLGICADSSISRWMSSIYTTGKFTAKSPEKTEYEYFSHGLYIDCNASSILRSGINPTGEIFSEGGMEFEDVNITVNAASHKDNSYAIGCLKAVNFISGEFQLNGALGDLVTDSKTCGIYTIDDITIGSEAAVDAYAIMLGSGNSGQGVASRGGKLTVSGILSADGNTKAVDIHNSKETGIVLDGTFVYIPDEGKVFSANGADTTISEYNNKPASSVRIMKGRYYDIWIAGERLNTERLKYEHYLTDGTITFEPEVSNLYLDKVTYLNYSMAPSPSAKEKNITDLIYTEIPVTLRGDAKLSNKNAVLSACNNSIVDLQGAFDFKSTDSSAIVLKNAILAFNSVDQVVNLEGENGSAISGYEGSSVEIYYGTINAKGAQEGIFCLGDILIKGGELNAEGGTCAIQTLFTGNEITLAKGLDIIVPEGGKIKTAKDSSNRDYCTVVDKDDNVAKKAKIALQKYDLWLGSTQVTSVNRDDILGDGTAAFDPTTSTLKLNGTKSIKGVHNAGGLFGDVLIYSELPLNIEGNAEFDTEISAIAIKTPSILDASTINGNFTFKAGNAGIHTNGVLKIKGNGYNKIKAETKNFCLYAYVITIEKAVVDLKSQDNAALIAETALGLDSCDLTAEGDPMAIGVLSDLENAIVLTEGMKLVEPEDGKIVTEAGNTVIKGSDGELAKKVRFASLAVAASALNPVPAGIETASKVILVKGQKFTLPGSGWKVVDDKTSKKFVSVSKKGVLKAMKKTGDSDVAKITNGERTIEITVVQPKFNNKSIKVSFKGTYIAQDVLGFVPGSADLPVAYFSNAPEILEVDSMGHLIPLTAGTATVTAYVNGTAYKCKVKVKEEKIATERPIYMIAGKKRTLKIKNVKLTQYNSSDTNIATVDNKGKVTAVAPGKCYIVAADKELAEYYLNIFVEDITIENPEIAAAKSANKYNATMTAGQKIKIKFKNVEQTVMFKSNKGEVAYVNEAGEICAQKPGVAKLTGKINGKTVTIKVTVNEAP